jgi:subtilisin family serine protease
MKAKCSGTLLRFFLVVTLGLILATYASAAEKSSLIRVNVGIKPHLSVLDDDDIAAQYGGKKILNIPAIRLKTYKLPSAAYQGFRDKLLASGRVAFVERDVQRMIPIGESPVTADYAPDDPRYPLQWGPSCIGAEQAWDHEILWGRPELIVAVIDTGIDLDHPDLAGSVDLSIDYDFVNNDDEAMDDNGHGTHCAGIIAAGFNNSIGIAGLQDVTLMAVKGLNAAGAGWDSVLAECIVYATDNGAKVLSNSWGSLRSSSTLAQATYYAYTQGAVVVAAAGNYGTQREHFPAAYPWVLGVAALEDCDTKAGYSSYGARNVFISAPGSNIWSTYWNDSYASESGTSMACPHVAAVAAMWIGAYLDYVELTPNQVMVLLATTADDLGDPGKDIYFGWGRVNMFPWDD